MSNTTVNFGTGGITAATFTGDGSGLTNVTSTVVSASTVTDTFSSTTSKTVTHNFGTKNVIVTVYDDSDNMIIPQQVTTTNANVVTVTLATATSGRVVVAKGGHIVSNTSQNAVSASYALTASYALNGGGGGGGSVTETATFTADFTNAATASFNHNFGTKNVIVQTYFDDDTLFFPETITTTDLNTVDVTFSSATDGRVVIAKGGHMISSSHAGLPGITGSAFTNVSSVEVAHGFGTKEVVVSVYDSNDNLIMPSNVRTTTTSSIDVTFAQSRSGRIVVSKGGHVVTGTTAHTAAQAESLTTAGSRQPIISVSTAVTASLFSTHLLRGSVSMSLPEAVPGDWVKVSNRITSSYAHLVPGGGQKIMGSTDSLEMDSDNAGLEFVYADSTDGWIIIGN